MFFDQTDEICQIAKRTGTAIFVLPPSVDVIIKNSFLLQPEKSRYITLDQVKDILKKCSTKQLVDRFIIIRPADLLDQEAANALLKHLEEPKPKVHFVLITSAPSSLLPTILSRAQIYFLRSAGQTNEITADANVKKLAKQLLVASGADLVTISEQIARKKDRQYALLVVETAVKMLYQTYFLNHKPIFLKKLPQFLNLYERISENGHIKLQIIANLC